MNKFETVPGQFICKQGERGDLFFILLKGEVEIIKDGIRLASLTNLGATFGEVALSSATAVRTASILCPVPSLFLTMSG